MTADEMAVILLDRLSALENGARRIRVTAAALTAHAAEARAQILTRLEQERAARRADNAEAARMRTELERQIAEARAEEREACFRVVMDAAASPGWNADACAGARQAAAAIRAREPKP